MNWSPSPSELLRVSHIARQTLGFYRESTRATNFRVAEVAQQILDLYRRNCEKKQLHVLAELDPDATLYGLRGEIVQLFSNIIANAIDACGVGGAIRVRVRALRGSGNRAGSSGGVSIVVADNGVGISNSTAARIFEPFYTTKRDLGTGLGLWVTKNIVENHDGTIRLRSRFGSADSGTLFRIVLRGVAQEQKQTAAGLREAA